MRKIGHALGEWVCFLIFSVWVSEYYIDSPLFSCIRQQGTVVKRPICFYYCWDELFNLAAGYMWSKGDCQIRFDIYSIPNTS